MSRQRSIPKYRRHKQSGQAVVTLSDGLGRRRDVLLGKYGSKESRAEYARVLAEWETADRTLQQPEPTADLTVNELILRFWPWAEQHYRHADGTPTNEIVDFQGTLKPLKRLYGHTLVKDFGPLALKAVREVMIDGSWRNEKEKAIREKEGRPMGWSRGVVNHRIGRIKRMFKWAVENELIPSSVLHGLQAVRGLQRGRSAAREMEPVKPVPEAFVAATLPFLRPQVGAMVGLQLVTGMRPGEVVIMRGCDLDTSGNVWIYKPSSHKMAYHGHERIVPIGPRGQEILKPWLRLNLQEYLFQPAEAMAHMRAEQRLRRRTPVQPSQMDRRKKNPRRRPGNRYDVAAYGRAIRYACTKAGVPLWHAHQLRHTKATEIRKHAGLDAARAVLGHRSPSITEVYAEIDMVKAAEIAAKLG